MKELDPVNLGLLGCPGRRGQLRTGPRSGLAVTQSAVSQSAVSQRLRTAAVGALLVVPPRSQTNGKAERFIQSALREWAYGRPYENSEQRRQALPIWNHFYNWHRPHHGINLMPPMSRLSIPRKNLLTLHN